MLRTVEKCFGRRLLSPWIAHARTFTMAALLLCVFSHVQSAPTTNVLVVYEPPSAKFEQTYNDILDGIRNSPDAQYQLLEIHSDSDDDTSQLLSTQPPDVVITLGKKVTQHVISLNPEIPVVSGGSVHFLDNKYQVSYTPSPQQIFAKLKLLSSQTKNVYTVTSRQAQDPLIKVMKRAAEQLQIHLHINYANNTNQALKAYQNIIKDIDTRTDAIWIQADRITSHEKTIVTMLLRQAWKKSFIVFSSKPSHARKGALFSAYPDHFGLGTQLAALSTQAALNEITSDQDKQTLRHLIFALNKRTAAHLNIDASEHIEDFARIFPATN